MMTRGKLTVKTPKNTHKSDGNRMGEQQKTTNHSTTPSSLLADSIAARLKLSRRKCVQPTPPQPWWVLRRTVAKAPQPQKPETTKTPAKSVTKRSKSSSGKRKKSRVATVKRDAVTPCTTRKTTRRKSATSNIQAPKISKRSQMARAQLVETPLTRKRVEKLCKEALKKEELETVKIVSTTAQIRTEQTPADKSLVEFIQTYKMQRTNVLGSGQFGIVFAGTHRQTGRNIAVKVIAKNRDEFSIFNIDTLRNEFILLRQLTHPGIVKFEMLSESKEEMFAVMERMDGDMLELILSQSDGRLNERTGKFLVRQILCAVRYLHLRGIAHCDLKPENILLTGVDSNFPHAKLCDFGYARLITGNQLRRSIVGTPAYLAPEVSARTGYNKMLDMWSIGVIIYVTLSGTFPFNEAEQITETCLKPEYLFPIHPWKQIAPEAVDLIQKLLRMDMNERLTVDQCIAHHWLQNALTYSDLIGLEKRLQLPQRIFTSEAEDHRWELELQTMGLIEAPMPAKKRRRK